MFGNKEKSTLTFQVEGRLSAYLSDIDNCENFTANSQTKLTKTMEMTECIHSLLDHIKVNCLSENKEFILKNKLSIDKGLGEKLQYILTWTPFKNTKTISGIVELRFIVPDFSNLTISNFKLDSIESLTNLIIDFTTLSYSNIDDKVERSLFVVKTKNFEKMTENFATLLKEELANNCEIYKATPTFLFLKHKDNVGHYHKHYSNYADE